MAQAVRAFSNLLPEIDRNDGTAEWRVLLSVSYVQARLIARAGADQSHFLAMYDDTSLVQHRELGRLLCDEVVAAQTDDPDRVADRLRRCVFEHLTLSPETATVRRLFNA